MALSKWAKASSTAVDNGISISCGASWRSSSSAGMGMTSGAERCASRRISAQVSIWAASTVSVCVKKVAGTFEAAVGADQKGSFPEGEKRNAANKNWGVRKT